MKLAIKILRVCIIFILSALIASNGWMLISQYVFKEDPPRLFGYSQLIVTSGSMQPTLRAGDVVLIKAKNSYGMGDVVTFRGAGDALITHRIVGRNSGGFITRGDANNVEDAELLHEENIVGEVRMSIPKMGSFFLFLKSPLGLLILIAAGFLLIELPVLLDGRKGNTKGKHGYEKGSGNTEEV